MTSTGKRFCSVYDLVKADLAAKDEKILDDVSKFFGEYVVNMLDLFERSADRLPATKR